MDQWDVQIPEVAQPAGSPQGGDAAQDQDKNGGHHPGPGPAPQDRVSHLKASRPRGFGEHGFNLPLNL